ncbi:MAG: sulfotransferase family 2 domain-containing protein [Pseudomonadota bacterium]
MNLEDAMTRKLLFTHVPKAGGSSIHVLLQQIIGRRFVYRVKSRHMETKPTLAHLTQEEKDTHVVFHGHFTYGVHESFSVPCAYMSVVRDPIDRFVSLYRFTIERGREDRRERVKDLSFVDFFENVLMRQSRGLSRGAAQCRMVSGASTKDKIKAVIDNDYMMIGSVRQQNDMQDILLSMYGGEKRETLHANRSQTVVVDKDQVADMRKKHGAEFEMDNWLVSYCEQKFDSFREAYARNPICKPFDLTEVISARRKIRNLHRIEEEYEELDKEITKMIRKNRRTRRASSRVPPEQNPF